MPLLLIGFWRYASGVLSFFSKPPGLYIGIGIAAALGLWWFGNHQYHKGWMAAEAEAADAAANINAGQPKIIERLRTIYVPAEAKIKTVTQTIIKEVPVYVTQRDDARCVIPNGFVRLHDSATKGELPGGPAGTDGEPSGVELSTVAKTVTGNYGTCHLALSRLSEWQEWYRQNRALWNGTK